MRYRQEIPNSAFYRRMALGHLQRTGHPLTGYLTKENADDFCAVLVRTCC